MKVNRFSFHQSLCCLVLTFFCFSSTVDQVNADSGIMTSILKSLWNSLFGGSRPSQPAEGLKDPDFPDTLEGFGYHFNHNGKLQDKSGGGFQFTVRKDDPEYNQRRYNALGEVITDHLYKIMENDLKLERVYVPVDAKAGEARSFIFRSKDAEANRKLMVLIHGSGAVRAGQWSRRLIINEDINTGSQLPYIRQAVANGFGVIVMNPNLNQAVVHGQLQKIRGSEKPENHGTYVWRHFVQPARAQHIAMVAHSYGGIVACTVAENFLADFRRRVFSIVFTDSVHNDGKALWSKPVKDFMKQRAVNFISSREPLNTRIQSLHTDHCLSLSAGTPEHERTSHTCIRSAFLFINSNLSTWTTVDSISPDTFLKRLQNLKSDL